MFVVVVGCACSLLSFCYCFVARWSLVVVVYFLLFCRLFVFGLNMCCLMMCCVECVGNWIVVVMCCWLFVVLVVFVVFIRLLFGLVGCLLL